MSFRTLYRRKDARTRCLRKRREYIHASGATREIGKGGSVVKEKPRLLICSNFLKQIMGFSGDEFGIHGRKKPARTSK